MSPRSPGSSNKSSASPRKPTTVDRYIASLPAPTRAVAESLRRAIITAVPDAEESISYNMPAFSKGGATFLYFGAWKTHIALYPVARGTPAFEARVAPYRAMKDTIRFSYDAPLPIALVASIARSQARSRRG